MPVTFFRHSAAHSKPSHCRQDCIHRHKVTDAHGNGIRLNTARHVLMQALVALLCDDVPGRQTKRTAISLRSGRTTIHQAGHRVVGP